MKTNRLFLIIFLFIVACGQGGEETPEPQQEQTRMPTVAISPTAGVVVIFDETCPNGATFSADETARGIRALCLSGPAVPTNTPKPTPTLEPTVTKEPTVTPGATDTPSPEPTPIGHDLNACHGAMDGHTHGYCVTDLPPGLIRDFLHDNPIFQGVGTVGLSGPTENLYPWPIGKHEGYKHLYMEVEECHQFGETPGSDLCIRAIWMQVHSIGTAEAQRTPNSLHGLIIIADVCNVTFDECGIVQVTEPQHYGEVHSQYKSTDCPGTDIQYPSGQHTAQPPYVATHADGRDFFDRPARIFWSSLRNALMGSIIGKVNNLVQVAWTENAFEVTSGNPAECANPDFDRVWAASTDDGYLNQYVIWTVRLFIQDYPRPYDGFTDRNGFPALDCVRASFECLPIHIDATVPPGKVNFNLPVNNANFLLPEDVPVIDITAPGVHMPGFKAD